MQTNQTGRSMIEMLGVLTVIGVLTVGGLSVVAKARRQQAITQTVSEISQLIESSKKLSCQYDDSYGNYVNYLYRSETYPNGLEFSHNDTFTLSSDVKVKIPHVSGNTSGSGESTISHFIVELDDMDDDTCVNLATSNWGTVEGNGYIGAAFENDFAKMLANYPRMDPGTAAASCPAKLYLGFRVCK
jgi:type II secretory pathway pseudopilin PulG